MRANMRAFYRLLGERSPNGQVLDCGTPAACLGVLDEADDCGVYFVATASSAQRQGLASALLREALLEARERGCGTSSLQATAAGRAVYARLGHRDICALEMWEHRRS